MPHSLRCGLAVLVLFATGCSPAHDRPRALVLVVIDTLRGDRIGVAGYEFARTATLDALAEDGVRFTNAMTPVPVTLPAVASLLTGRLPFEHGVRDNDLFVLDESEETLAERFRGAGFRTAAVLGSAVLSADRGLTQGFESYDDEFAGEYPLYDPRLSPRTELFAATRRRANVVTDLALERVREFGDDPYFLLVHYFDVHSRYDPPPEFARLHPGRPYDGEVSFVDHEIGRLLDGLGDRSDAIVVVVADHGESQGEHGEPQHGFLLYEATLRVPVIVQGPGVPAGLVREDPMSLVDLEPTLAATFGLGSARVPRSGRTLSWAEPEEESAPLYAETLRTRLSYQWAELRAVRWGNWKLISGPVNELYDLSQDPDELRNLGDVDPAFRLRAWLDDHIAEDDPARIAANLESDIDPERRALLESLGYIGSDSPASAEGALPHPRQALPAWVKKQWAKEHLRHAARFVRDGRNEEAIAHVDSALTETPDDADAYALRAHARAKLGDVEAARRDYDRALELDPDHVGAHAALAHLEEERGLFGEAAKRWRIVVAAEPDDERANASLARWYVSRDDYARAIPHLRRLTEISPSNLAYRVNLGLVAFRAGELETAREHLEWFLQAAPQDPQIEEIRARLREIEQRLAR